LSVIVFNTEERAMHCRTILYVALVALAVGSTPSLGQESALVTGEVVKIDEPAGKISIKHGPIAGLNLNEDGKTDDFRPKDGLLFNALKVGDKIRFSAERANGELTIVKVEKQ
jgi:Cu(I)/Ag(I) efflux system periplasmic protein CusF